MPSAPWAPSLAGVIMLTTGWYLADPLISMFIGVLILYSSWSLIKDSLSVLMQSVPKGIRLDDVRQTIEAVDGVTKFTTCMFGR